MLEQLINANKVVGVKQTLRALRAGQAQTVFLADDAEDKVKLPIQIACREAGLTPVAAENMAVLGEACGIDIGAACACIIA